MFNKKIPVLMVSGLLAVNIAAPDLRAENSDWSPATDSMSSDDDNISRSRRKRRKRKRRRRGRRSRKGRTVHKEQERRDRPYRYETTLSISLSQNSRKDKIGDLEFDLGGSGNFRLSSYFLFLKGKSFGLGPIVNLTQNATKSVVGADTSTTTLTTWDLGAMVKYNIGNLDRDIFLPFVFLNLRYASSSSDVTPAPAGAGAADDAGGNGLAWALGAGLHYFVDSNIALSGSVSYEQISTSSTVTVDSVSIDTSTTLTNFNFINIGFTIFI